MVDPTVDLNGVETISLIDVSNEDDLLLSASVDCLPSAGNSHMDEPTDNNIVTKDISEKCSEEKDDHVLSPRKGGYGKFNLRKSLAWDNAFFTNEGVLDSEELAIINSTFQKVESHVLPSIQEEIRKSFESCATFESDTLTIESIESELFGNLRASIQMSYDKFDKESRVEQSGQLKIPASKRAEASSRNVVLGKPPISLKRNDTHKLRQPVTSKEAFSSRHPVSGKGNQKSMLKQPQTPKGGTATPTKKTSIPQQIQVKKNTRKDSGINHPSRFSDIFAAEKPPTRIPKTTSTPSASGEKTLRARAGRVSDQNRNIPVNPARKKLDSMKSSEALSNLGTKSKQISGKGQQSCLNFPAAVSPRSSLESIGSSSCSSVSITTLGSHALLRSNLEGTASQLDSKKFLGSSEIACNNASRAPLGSRAANPISVSSSLKFSRAASQSSSLNSSGESKLSKPSGLRMPRPKIGYFDAHANSGNSEVEHQSSIPRSTSKTGSSCGVFKSKLSNSPLNSSKTASQSCLETVSHSATSSSHVSPGNEVVTSVAVATTVTIPSPSASVNQASIVNDHENNSQISSDAYYRTYKSKPICESGNVMGDAAELLETISVEENSENKTSALKVPSTYEKPPCPFPSPKVPKTVSNPSENVYCPIAKSLGKENLLPLGNEIV